MSNPCALNVFNGIPNYMKVRVFSGRPLTVKSYFEHLVVTYLLTDYHLRA